MDGVMQRARLYLSRASRSPIGAQIVQILQQSGPFTCIFIPCQSLTTSCIFLIN